MIAFRSKMERFHTLFGLHSRIPTCCIRFFIDEWDGRELWRDEESPYARALKASRAQYVQCPQCLANGRVANLRICRVECGGDHVGDFYAD